MVALGMVACNFFESESPSAMDAAAVFSNENNTELAIAAVYEQFGQDKSYRNRLACGYQGMNTDAEYGTKNSGVADYNIYAITPIVLICLPPMEKIRGATSTLILSVVII